MTNFKDVMAVRDEFAQGNHFGSAEAENAQYLDSISGKLNTLKETWVSILSTFAKSDSIKSVLDLLITLSEAIDSVVKSLDGMGMLLPATIGFMSGGGNLLKNLAGYGDTAPAIRQVGNELVLVNRQAKKAFPTFSRMGNAFKQSTKHGASFTGGVKAMGVALARTGKDALKSFGSMAGGMLSAGLKGVALALAFKGIGWAIDNTVNKYKNLDKEIQANVDTNKSQIDGLTGQRKSLSDIAEEYDKLAGKAKRSAEEQGRYNELRRQIAETAPELVIGYDENNDPILKLNGSLENYIKDLDLAIDRKKTLLANDEMAQGKNAIDSLSSRWNWQGIEEKGLDAHYLKKQESDILTSRANMILKLNQINGTSNFTSFESELKSFAEHSDKMENQIIKGYEKVQKASQSEMEKVAEAQEGIIRKMFNNSGFQKLDEETQKLGAKLVSAFDFSEVDPKDFDKITSNITNKLATGDFDKSLGKISQLREELEKTHDFKKYEEGIKQYIPALADFLGVSETVASQMLKVPEYMKAPEDALESFLMSLGKTKQMMDFDAETQQLANQFNAIRDSLQTLTDFNNYQLNDKGNLVLTPEIVVDMKNNTDIPSQIRNMIGALDADGEINAGKAKVIIDVMTAYKLGDTDQSHKILDDVQKQLDEMLGKDKINIKDIVFDVDGKVESVNVDTSKLEETLKVFGGKEEVKKLFRTEVVGLDKVEHYSNIVKNLPADSDHTERFIVENSDALSKMNSYKEVKEWIISNPEVISTYKLNVDNDPELKQALADFEKNNGKVSESTVKVKEEGAKETKETLEETNKQADELSKDINLSVNNGELQGSVESFNKLIEYSSKLKDGEYKLSFTSDTGDSINQINSLKDAVNDLSSTFGSLPNVTLRIETALASQNITGLRNNIQKYNDSIGGLKTVTFKTETAKASQNVTGLKNNVSGYIRSYCGKSYSTKFNTQTALASQNMTGLKRNVSSYVGSYGGKTFTTTFKVVTKYSTEGSPTSASKGTKPGGVSASPEMGNPIPFNSEVENTSVARVGEVANVASTVSNMSSRATQSTPIAVTSANTLDAIKYNIELLKELENRIDMVANSLSNLDAKMENAVGTSKIKYLEQQNELLREQQKLQKELQDKLKQQQSYIKSALQNKGFNFNSDGNLTNYEEKLLAMEREAERLDKLAEDASKKSSDYKGDNDKTKESLEKQANDAKDKADKYKESLKEVNDLLSDYIDISTSKLPDAETEWQKLQNEIDKANQEIYNIKKNQALEHHKNKVEELQNAYDKLGDKLAILEGKLEHAYGKDRLDIMQQQIDLLEKQKKIQQDLINYLNTTKSSYQKELGNYGFKFDEDGMLTNQANILKQFENSKDYEKIKDLVEEYIKLQQDELPDATKEWQNLDNAIKDLYMDQLKIAKEIEGKITEAYKKEVEERKKAVEKETKAKLDAIKKQQDALKKQQDAYNKKRDEEDYEKDYESQLSKIEDLQKKIDLLSKDTSMGGQKKLAELLEQLAEEQKKLEEMQQDKVDKDTNDKFQEEMDKLDKQAEKIEEEADKIIEKLDELVTPENLDKIIKEALSTGSIKTIDGTLVDLKQFLLDYEDKYGDGLSMMGSVIKNDIASDLNTAMETLKSLEGILGKLNLNSSTRGTSRSTFGMSEIPDGVLRGIGSLINRSTGVTFNEPLIVVEGNVDRNVIDDLKQFGRQLERQITGNILNAMR